MKFLASQLLELFVVLCTADHFRYVASRGGNASSQARSKSGPVRPESMPTRLSTLISPLHGFTHFLIPTIYILSVVGAWFEQPQWMSTVAFPDVVYGIPLDGLGKNAARLVGCVASIALHSVGDSVFRHLGDQFHFIGRREKSRIVQTGPYAWVRHPLYSLVLLQEVVWSVMFWSYAPLYALVATATVFAVKIPIEEEAILRDDAVKQEYHAYKRKVPARVVPYVW